MTNETSPNVEIEVIADYACVVGENPLWHPGENAVYWTDIDTGRVFRYDPATGRHGIVFQGESGEKVGGFTHQEDGTLLFFMDRGAVRRWNGDSLVGTVHEEIPSERESRFNDVIADSRGRVFCGTMSTPKRRGRLYRLETDGALSVILEDIGCSNGLGFTPDGKYVYYTDSTERTIYRFAYNAATGALTDEFVFVRTPAGEGVPDGMTVDADGNVWSARWDGGALFCYSHADGSELCRIDLPAVRKVSSVLFGGPDYADMYVTTAGGDKKETDGANAGALFRVRVPNVCGVPEFVSRVHTS